MEKESIPDPFIADQGHHALVYRLYLGKKISIETLVLLDKLFKMSDNSDDIFLESINLLVKKYRPFVKLTDKMRNVGENLYK
jgi:hypothetical protein